MVFLGSMDFPVHGLTHEQEIALIRRQLGSQDKALSVLVGAMNVVSLSYAALMLHGAGLRGEKIVLEPTRSLRREARWYGQGYMAIGGVGLVAHMLNVGRGWMSSESVDARDVCAAVSMIPAAASSIYCGYHIWNKNQESNAPPSNFLIVRVPAARSLSLLDVMPIATKEEKEKLLADKQGEGCITCTRSWEEVLKPRVVSKIKPGRDVLAALKMAPVKLNPKNDVKKTCAKHYMCVICLQKLVDAGGTRCHMCRSPFPLSE